MKYIQTVYKTLYEEFNSGRTKTTYVFPLDIDEDGVGTWCDIDVLNKKSSTLIVDLFYGLDGNITDDYGNYSQFEIVSSIDEKRTVIMTILSRPVIDNR